MPGRQDRAGDLGQPAAQNRDLQFLAGVADGKIYLSNEDGVTVVIRAGPKFEVLAENDLAGYTLSSPAISDGHIFLRTTQFLYSIGKP